MITILYAVAAIVGFVCAIIILIELFKAKGALHGILGLLCGLYTFIWGWMNAGNLGKKNVMIIWTIALIAMIVLGGMGGMAGMQDAGAVGPTGG